MSGFPVVAAGARPRTSGALALLMLAAWQGAEASTVELSARDSVNYFYYFGGFAISGDEGEAGAPAPTPGGPWEGERVTSLAPRSLAIAGSDHADLHYLFWDGFLEETWDQAQDYTWGNGPGGATLHGSGHASIAQSSLICGLGTCGLATELHRSTNTQALEFELAAPSHYSLRGSTSGGQWVDLLVWSEVANRWNALVIGGVTTIDSAFDLGGQLEAGRYMVRNNPYTFSAGGADDVVNAWDYTLVLADATVVPLPAAWTGLLLAGACLLPRARRGAPPRPD